MKFKINDQIKITSGKDKGRVGKVEKILRGDFAVVVAGANISIRHQKPQPQGNPGGKIELAKPLSFGKIALVCPKCNKQTRVGFKFETNGTKYRFCKKCQAQL